MILTEEVEVLNESKKPLIDDHIVVQSSFESIIINGLFAVFRYDRPKLMV
jgi:hypothetical protein